MNSRCNHGNCVHYVPDFNIGFKIVSPKQGECYNGHNFEHHSLIFLLQGETEFSYNDFLYRQFVQGDLFFVPQAAEMHGIALTDSKMLILSFNNRVESLCDRCRISDQKRFLPEISYDFKPLIMTEFVYSFVALMEGYIKRGINCSFLHELKQKELFVLLGMEYSEKMLVELFFPIVGSNTDFKVRVMESYRYGQDVNELASKMGMSYSPFLRQFKQEFGETVKDWMQKQKAKNIKLRMSLPSTTISNIIWEFGFTDLPHFIRFCRKQYGCTPKELMNSIKRSKST
ncbi:MAG: helix-turn-helix transcriptional regulator [Bacteroidales bacterium]